MKFKVHGGQIADRAAFLKPQHIDKEVRSRDLNLIFGTLSHAYTDNWGNPNNFVVAIEIETAEIITEDNKVNFVEPQAGESSAAC